MTNKMRLKVLVVAAHPDDEVLGCGATIWKHVQNSDDVWILIVGEGVTARPGLTDVKTKNGLKKIKGSALSASKILGAKNLLMLNFPDNKFDTLPRLQLIQSVEKVIKEFGANIIYTHSNSDLNIDHRLTLEAVEVSARPYQSSVSSIYSFETPSSTEWNFSRDVFRPNVFISLNHHHLDKKLAAITCYKQEMQPFPHPRSKKYLISLAQIRGAQSGFGLAEAFELIYDRQS